jgi:hypothetical protein
VETPNREDLRRRLHALVEDALDQIERDNPAGYDLGVIALSTEVMHERSGSQYLKRTESGYTPAG